VSDRGAATGRVLCLLLLAAGCWLLAACGSEEGTSTSAPTAAAPTTTAAGGDDGPSRPPVGDGRGGVELREIGRFELPLYVAQPAGDGPDVYVVEQGGRIIRVTPAGKQSTFLDVGSEIVAGGEQGLLSLAFAPDYAESGRFYIDYTNPDGDTRVVEYKASGGTVDPASARVLLKVDQPYPNHNGGQLQFGPDGYLYVGLGDGGSGGDPDRRGLDLSTLLGKILRVDPKPDGDSPYTIPSDNPFVDVDGARPEIYSYGLRNPWRFSFDGETGDLTIGDVGQDTEEEIDIVGEGRGAGASFGWSAYEGNLRFNEDQESADAIAPVLVADHDEGNCSITGGYVVRDRGLRSLYGRYLWGDLCIGDLRSFTATPEKPARDDRPLGPSVPRLASFGEGVDGTIYVVSIQGPVYELAPAR